MLNLFQMRDFLDRLLLGEAFRTEDGLTCKVDSFALDDLHDSRVGAAQGRTCIEYFFYQGPLTLLEFNVLSPAAPIVFTGRMRRP